MSERDKDYLEACNAYEVKSLEVSRAAKSLEKLKKELEQLSLKRNELRKKLVDADFVGEPVLRRITDRGVPY